MLEADEEVSVQGEVGHNPVLVGPLLVSVADQPEGFFQLRCAHVDFSDQQGCFEAIDVEEAVLVEVLGFKLLADDFSVVPAGLVEFLKRGGSFASICLGSLKQVLELGKGDLSVKLL